MFKTDDLKLKDLITEGSDGDFVIVGCPFDHARRRSLKKGGEENGPCCLRRFYHKVGPLKNPEYQLDLSNVKISDFGNIALNQELKKKYTAEQAMSEIRKSLKDLYEKNKIPIVFGGSKQSSLGTAQAFFDRYPEGRVVVLAGKASAKRMEDQNKLTSDSFITALEEEFQGNYVLFGPDSKHTPGKYTKLKYSKDFIRENGGLEESIRGLLAEFDKHPIHITLSVEFLQNFKGCRDQVLTGFTAEDVASIYKNMFAKS